MGAIRCEVCNVTQLCYITECKKELLCFAIWNNVSGVIEVRNKGCWLNEHVDQTDECKGHIYLSPHVNVSNEVLCFCNTDLCNKVLKFAGFKRG